MYVVAIKDTAAWEGDSPAELSMIGFWNLVIVWLKVGILVHFGIRSFALTNMPIAAHSLEILPSLGSTRWCRSP